MPDRLKSRKFWLALIGAVLPVAGQLLTEEISAYDAMSLSAAILVAYVFGQSYVDGKKAIAESEADGE
ncbi:MAG: hypothetical protein CMA63_06750 [Euryarchaeota archaeon]|nr:hypothetical protein [Euryarchaeota archaeon]